MSRTLTRIYALLVCFVTVVCITITTGMALYQIVKIVAPELTMRPHQHRYLMTDEAYRRAFYPPGVYSNPELMEIPENSHTQSAVIMQTPATGQQEAPSDEQIAELRKKEWDALMENERRFSIASLIRLTIVLLVACPLFYVHWRIAQRPEEPTTG